MRRGAVRERGAAAVEAALLLGFFLVPLLLGILYYGQYFWIAQRVPQADLGLQVSQLRGSYCSEQQLVDRVYALLGGNLTTLGSQLGVPLGLDDIAVEVVNVLPVVGVDLAVSLRVPILDQVSSLLPLPGGGALVQDLTLRLADVTVGTGSC